MHFFFINFFRIISNYAYLTACELHRKKTARDHKILPSLLPGWLGPGGGGAQARRSGTLASRGGVWFGWEKTALMSSLKANEADEVGYLPDFCWG